MLFSIYVQMFGMRRRMDLGWLTQEFQWAFSPKGLHRKFWLIHFKTPLEPCYSAYISKHSGHVVKWTCVGLNQEFKWAFSPKALHRKSWLIRFKTPLEPCYSAYISKCSGHVVNWTSVVDPGGFFSKGPPQKKLVDTF